MKNNNNFEKGSVCMLETAYLQIEMFTWQMGSRSRRDVSYEHLWRKIKACMWEDL